MSTKNPRLNVVLEPKLYSSVSHLAKKEGVSLSLMARDLIKEAIEIYEDRYWDKAAQARDKTLQLSKALSHQEVWK